MKTIAAIAIATLTSYCHVSAHADVSIKISADGTLLGLPAEYSPAKIEIIFDTSRSPKHPVVHASLSIGKSRVVIPSQILYLLNTNSNNGIIAHASWTHKSSQLPPYIVIEFLDPGYNLNNFLNPGYKMTFNLRSCKLFSMGRNYVNQDKRSGGTESVQLDRYCSQALLKQFFEPVVIRLDGNK